MDDGGMGPHAGGGPHMGGPSGAPRPPGPARWRSEEFGPSHPRPIGPNQPRGQPPLVSPLGHPQTVNQGKLDNGSLA